MLGHAGDAYGLLSDYYLETLGNFGLVFITNGYVKGYPYQSGVRSAFNLPEESAFDVIARYSRSNCISAKQ